MNAKELMIGSIVSLSEDERKSFACEVVELRNGTLLVRLLGYKDCEAIGYNQVYPIPLTAEMLEKNGFVRQGVPYEWEDGFYVQKWDTIDVRYSFPIRETDGYDGFTLHGIEINSVHLMQHALRLCGLDELADDFKI